MCFDSPRLVFWFVVVFPGLVFNAVRYVICNTICIYDMYCYYFWFIVGLGMLVYD